VLLDCVRIDRGHAFREVHFVAPRFEEVPSKRFQVVDPGFVTLGS
jgi:hypothetical protein